MMITTNVETRISFGHSYGTDSDGMHATLEVTDLASRISLLDIRLTPGDIGHLLGGQAVKSTVQIPSGSIYAERVGKIMQYSGIEIPESFKRMPRSPKPGGTSEPSEAMVEWAESHKVANGWQEFRWHYNNFGWSLGMRRWVDATEEQMDALLGPWV